MSGHVSNQLCFDKGRLRSLCFKQSTETGGSAAEWLACWTEVQ